MPRSREWRRRIGGADGEVCGQTFDGQVEANADDGFSSGVFDASNGELKIGDETGFNINSFARIDNVTVPAGATLEAATMDWVVSWGGDDGANTNTNIYMEDADDPAAPTSKADHDGRSRTTAFTVYDDQDFNDEDDVDGVDIMTAVQEVVDRGGWASGQAMIILWDDDSSANNKRYTPYAHDSSGPNAIELHIQYCA